MGVVYAVYGRQLQHGVNNGDDLTPKTSTKEDLNMHINKYAVGGDAEAFEEKDFDVDNFDLWCGMFLEEGVGNEEETTEVIPLNIILSGETEPNAFWRNFWRRGEGQLKHKLC
ncbi:hypothetical protein V6N11_082878 [Hibiscus sabdariffa]|uniref:Uncharacterized protein n=1 Tax=Hibiscus sabdariffa TaxID=183260 RepID=A0ABR2QKT7_9ROSI